MLQYGLTLIIIFGIYFSIHLLTNLSVYLLYISIHLYHYCKDCFMDFLLTYNFIIDENEEKKALN